MDYVQISPKTCSSMLVKRNSFVIALKLFKHEIGNEVHACIF